MNEKLLLFAAYELAKSVNPEITLENLKEYLDSNTGEKDKIYTQIQETPELLKMIEEQYANELSETDMYKNGGKLEHIKKLQSFKKGGKMKSKKCACGCELVETKEAGGKITSKCACGCSVKKKETGGVVSEKIASMNKKAAVKTAKKK